MGERATQTLYIDVYFLINFTVDILALYFATVFAKCPSSIRRLIISALVGAGAAVIIVFLPEVPILKLTLSAISLFLICFIATKPIGLARRVRYIFAFLIFEALFGGGTYFLWGVLDEHLYGFFDDFDGGAVNKKMLVFSLIVLLAIGVFKMLVMFFTNNVSEGKAEIEIEFLGKRTRLEAFVDSGNLAVDPMDMSPILLIKPKVAKMLFPDSVIDLRDPDILESEIRRRIRLIPATFGGRAHVLTGVKPSKVTVIKDGESYEIRVTVAIDKEGGTYGGFDALLPSSVLENVR